MKRILFFILLFALPSPAGAQKAQRPAAFDAFYRKYQGREGFTTVEITGEMIRMMGNTKAENRGREGMAKALEGIDGIRIVVAGRPDNTFTADAKRVAAASNCSLIYSVNDSGQSTWFYFKGAAVRKSSWSKADDAEFLMISQGGKDNVVIRIVGDIDVKKISSLSGIGIGGMGNLEGLEK